MTVAPLALVGCIDWSQFRGPESDAGAEADAGVDAGPAEWASVAPRCVGMGEDVSVAWSALGACTPIGFTATASREGCALVPIDAPTDLGVDCGALHVELPVYVDAPISSGSSAVPFVSATIDGDRSEWGAQHFRLVGEGAGPVDQSDLYAEMAIGWDERGLSIYAAIEDDSVETFDTMDVRQLYRSDGIEVLVDPGADGSCDGGCGLDASRGERQIFIEHTGRVGSSTGPVDGVEVFAMATGANGYVIEARLEWSLFLVTDAAPGRELWVNIAANDRDGGSRTPDEPPALLWRLELDGSGAPLYPHPYDSRSFRRVGLRCGAQPAASCP